MFKVIKLFSKIQIIHFSDKNMKLGLSEAKTSGKRIK
jgi:hypothetical protein